MLNSVDVETKAARMLRGTTSQRVAEMNVYDLDALVQQVIGKRIPSAMDITELICHNLPYETCESWMMEFRDQYKLVFEYVPNCNESDLGSLHVTYPSRIHEGVSQLFDSLVESAIGREYLTHFGKLLCTIGKHKKEPDASLSPNGLHVGPHAKDSGDGKPFPTVVLEVSYKHESNCLLKQELHLWLCNLTSVRIALGISIRSPRNLYFFQFHRSSKGRIKRVHTKLNFGQGLCTRPGMDQFVIQLPLKLIFFGVGVPAELKPFECISIDLYEIQQFILGCL